MLTTALTGSRLQGHECKRKTAAWSSEHTSVLLSLSSLTYTAHSLFLHSLLSGRRIFISVFDSFPCFSVHFSFASKDLQGFRNEKNLGFVWWFPFGILWPCYRVIWAPRAQSSQKKRVGNEFPGPLLTGGPKSPKRSRTRDSKLTIFELFWLFLTPL